MKQRLVDVVRMYRRCPDCWTLLNGLGACWMCRINEKHKEKHGTDSLGRQKERPEPDQTLR